MRVLPERREISCYSYHEQRDMRDSCYSYQSSEKCVTAVILTRATRNAWQHQSSEKYVTAVILTRAARNTWQLSFLPEQREMRDSCHSYQSCEKCVTAPEQREMSDGSNQSSEKCASNSTIVTWLSLFRVNDNWLFWEIKKQLYNIMNVTEDTTIEEGFVY